MTSFISQLGAKLARTTKDLDVALRYIKRMNAAHKICDEREKDLKREIRALKHNRFERHLPTFDIPLHQPPQNASPQGEDTNITTVSCSLPHNPSGPPGSVFSKSLPSPMATLQQAGQPSPTPRQQNERGGTPLESHEISPVVSDSGDESASSVPKPSRPTVRRNPRLKKPRASQSRKTSEENQAQVDQIFSAGLSHIYIPAEPIQTNGAENPGHFAG